MGYFLATAITLNRSSMFNSLRYFSFQIRNFEYPKIWWRPGTEDFADDIRPYKITFSEQLVKNLKYKLRVSGIVQRVESRKTYYDSINMSMLSKLLHYWAYYYNFKEREKYINSFPHFMTHIQGLDIHFVHVNPRVEERNVEKRLKPLLLLHGWPSSIIEFYNLVQAMNILEEREIIIPSLPGFGFSSAPTISGFSCIEMNVVLKNLMLRLGHDKFNVMDGSYDRAINSRIMSILFPQHVCNDFNMTNYINWEKGYIFSKLGKKIPPIEKVLEKFEYFEYQPLEINTVAIDLNDSPVALAAYFIDAILNHTFPVNYINDTEEENFTNMIDNLMMYCAPHCVNTAMQIYAEQSKYLPDEFSELFKNL